VVAKPGSPFPTALVAGVGQIVGQVVASSQYVYWPIGLPSINGISGQITYSIIQYDILTGAVSHLPQPTTNPPGVTTSITNRFRVVAVYGDNVGLIYNTDSAHGVLQFQTPAFGTITYMPSGWLFTSHLDFNTPGIIKRFRRVEVHHAPLNAGEQILIEAWVDNLDPLSLTTSSVPVPSSATATNTVVGSTSTVMTLGVDTVGRTMTLAMKLTAGNSQLTTPRINWLSIEVGGTWVFEVTVDCTAKRRLLNQEGTDEQGLMGKDLSYLLLLAYENGNTLTLYHRNGTKYVCAIESVDFWNPSPQVSQDNQRPQDEEWVVHAVLRQVA
jgi:hypothetical protein